MLRASIGAFRVALGQPILVSKTTPGGLRQQFARGAGNMMFSNAALAQVRTGIWSRLQNLGRIPKSKNVAKIRQPRFFSQSIRQPFRTSKTRNSQAPPRQPVEPEPLSLSGRLRKLSREYGWSAVGVYFAFSVLDFPFCFLLVKALGTDRIAAAEHVVVSNIQKVIPERVQEFWREYKKALKSSEQEEMGDNKISEEIEMAGWGVKEAEQRNQTDATLATQLALAYAIHKSFIFVRVPLTAAVTPKVVKTLRSWGWQIGKRRPKQLKK